MQCSVCTESIDPNSRFCQWCGTPIGENVVRLARPLDRRHATILFADIVDSTAMVRDLEPELALERLSPIMETMKRTIAEHGGAVCRDQGDGIMALFGAPLSDDRHAVNACLAGLALLERTAASGLLSAHCRVGIHSGIVVGHTAMTSSGPVYGASGEAVHLAARLETAAQVGTVLISKVTHQLTAGHFVAYERRLSGLKGFDQEVTAFELGNPTSVSQWSARTEHSAPAFSGRGQEMARLREGYEDSFFDAAVISGDPAIGKSRLVHEFINSSVSSPAVIHAVLCEQSLSRTPYAALRRFVVSILGLPVEASEEQIGLVLRTYIKNSENPAICDETALQFLLGLPVSDRLWAEVESAAKRRRIAMAIVDLLSRQAKGEARNIVLVEDVHWADSASVATLDTVKTQLAGRTFFFLVTTRDADAQHTCLLARPRAVLLRLEPLANDASERILDELLGRSPTLLRVKGRLIELGGGTPLFLQQLVQWLADSRSLVGSPGNYRLAIHADQLQLPPSLHAATLWRVDRLPSQAQHVLSLAAILQQDIGVSAIAFMSGLENGQARSELDLLVERSLLVRQTGTDEARFSFRHTLIRESVYDSLTYDRRAELHATALTFLETVPPDGYAYRDNLLSTHAFACHNWRAVAKYSQIVGERAVAASAYREAAGHFEHAIDALYRLPRDRQTLEAAIDARLQARVCYSAMAKHDLCLAHIVRADQLARELGDDKRVLACTIFRAGVLNFTGPVRESLSMGVEALAKAEAMASIPHIAIAGYVLGQAHYASGNYRDAVAAFAAGGERLVGEMAMIRLGTTGTAAAMCAALQAASHASLGEFTDASACLARANGIARHTGRPYDIISYAYAEGITEGLQGNDDAAIAAFERALENCRAADIETFVTTLAGQLGHAYVAVGRIDAALELLEPALEEALTLQNQPQVATLKRQLGFAALCQDDLGRADRLANEAAAIAAAGGYRMIHSSALHLQAMVHLHRGDGHLHAGLQAAERSIEIAQTLGAAPVLAKILATHSKLRELALKAGPGRAEASSMPLLLITAPKVAERKKDVSNDHV
jgi:class 3 adenylate cyclase/tetratricopeptide (TPR) repeat protein